MAVTLKRIAGPQFLAAAAADIYTPPASTIYTVLSHLHFANVTAVSATFTVYVGATGGSAAGTQLFETYTLGPYGVYDYYCDLRMGSTDFLTGLASAPSTVTITVEGEQVVV